MSSFASDGSPCVYISGEQDDLESLRNVILVFAEYLGIHAKKNLINHEVEILMPKIYARNHKKFFGAGNMRNLPIFSLIKKDKSLVNTTLAMYFHYGFR